MSDRGTTIVLVRHGVTDWNRERRFQGQIDIPLNEEGRRQAELTGRRIASDPHRHRIAAVHTSDLSRAAQTAEPIARALGLPMLSDPALRERHYGAFEGRTHDELERDQAEAWQRWRSREPDFALPGGGESLREFHARVERALLGLAARYPSATVVAVAHGGVLDCAFRIAAGLPLDAPRGHDLLNASLNRIAFDGEGFRLVDWADVAHLEEALDDVEARG
ncbi:histidine phosphatase family protein [Burkholderiaceae bacterium FT117]|uniref:histidine phosphatase family protein n=1 Tax=Zeimonas sediminis TaxID=2944268 RepID=UPI002342CE72|nr:histidine phosphatase family protein [Zeimonas sediminis]MCM5572423.1 histidine phosphatase family protein [Zeimonas sediminis]